MASNVYYWGGGFLRCDGNKVMYNHTESGLTKMLCNGVNYTDADAFWAKKNDNGEIENYEVSFTRCTPKMRCTYHDTILDEDKYGTDDAIRVINDTTDIWSINIDDGESCIMTAYENPSSGTLPSYNVPTDVHTIYGIAEFHFIPEFYNNSSITPTSETAVGEWEYLTPLATRNGMFEGTSIITCQLPCKIGKISTNTFSGCTYLTSYTETPDFLVEIGNNAFDGCTSLPKITLGKFVRALGGDAFKGCSSAETIWWSGLNNDGTGLCCLDTIPSGCFSGCVKLRNTSFGDGTNVNTNQLIIPDGITGIGSTAFAEVSTNRTDGAISSMTFVNGTVKSIGDGAFVHFAAGASNTFDINGFSGVTSIGNDAFFQSGVRKIDKTSNVTSMGEEAFYDCPFLLDFDFSGMTVIPTRAFEGDRRLSSITNVNNITEIGEDAFSGCSGLSISLSLPKCTSIGKEAFDSCSSLKSANISAVTSVPMYAFYKCSSLSSVTLTSCESIGDYAFRDCSGLTKVDVFSCHTIGNLAFAGCSSLSGADFDTNFLAMDNVFGSNAPNVKDIRFRTNLTSVSGYSENRSFSGAQVSGVTLLIDYSGSTVSGLEEIFALDKGMTVRVNKDLLDAYSGTTSPYSGAVWTWQGW